MAAKKDVKPPGWSILKNIPTLFDRKTVDIHEFNERMNQPIRLWLTKKETFELVKDLKKNGVLEYQPNRGRLLFR